MSRNRINVIVDGNHLDLYEDSKVIMNQKIQDVKDISKVFTDYTEEFTIPASPANNKVFKHAPRKDSDDFDMRGFYNSVIEVNGSEYNRGYVEFLKANFKSGKLYSYSIRHYGNLLTLSRIIGDKKLTDIRGVFSKYNFPQDYRAFRDLLITGEDEALPNTTETWWDGFKSDNVDDNVRVFLTNDTENRFLFNDSTSFEDGDIQDGDINVAYTAWTSGAEDPDNDWNGAQGPKYNGIVLDRMKASLKESAVLKGIEEGFVTSGLKFSRGLDSNNKPTSVKSEVVAGKEHFFGSDEFEKAWLLFYNKEVGGGSQERTLFFENDWDPGDLLDRPFGLERYCSLSLDGYGNVYPPFSPYYKNVRNFTDYYVEIDLTTSDNTIPWTLEFHIDNTKVTWSQSGSLKVQQDRKLSTPDAFLAKGNEIIVKGQKILSGADYGYSSINCFTGEFIVKSDEPLTITGTININKVWLRDYFTTTRYHQHQLSNTVDDISTDSANYTLDTNTPNIKIMDYLDGLAKTYNLMYYADFDSNGNRIIVAETADRYYNGEVINLTQSVDSQVYEVKKPQYYTEVDFKYKKSGTFQTQEFDNNQATPYGDLRHEVILDNSFLVPSKKYEIKNPFEMILLNNPTNTNLDASNLTKVAFTYAWLVDNGQSASEIAAFRHYGSKESVGLNGNGLLFKNQNQQAIAEVNDCNLMSSYRYGNDVLDGTLLYSTNTEDPLTLDGSKADDPSLFNRYWKNTIIDLFDRHAKIHSFDARLSRADIAKLKLSQNVLISDNTYRINEAKIDLLSGKANLELISLNQPDVIGAYRNAYTGGFIVNTIVINNFFSDDGFDVFDTDNVVLTVDASGGSSDLTYRWFLNGEEVLGENGNTYELTPTDGDTVYAEVSDERYSVDTITETFTVTTNTKILGTLTVDKNTVISAGDVITATVTGGEGTVYNVSLVNVQPTDFIDTDTLSKTTDTIDSSGTDTFTMTVPAYEGDLIPSWNIRVTNAMVPSDFLTTVNITQSSDDTLIAYNEDFIVTDDGDFIQINK